MSRDHGRVTVLFGREYEWRHDGGRLVLGPFYWPIYSPGKARRGIRQPFALSPEQIRKITA
jgi:hypothetical protein